MADSVDEAMRIGSAISFARHEQFEGTAVVERREAPPAESADPRKAGHVRVSLSPEAEAAIAAGSAGAAHDPTAPGHAAETCPDCAAAKSGEAESSAPDRARAAATADRGELSEDEQRQVAEMKHRDAEVRAHEQTHIAASGGHAQGGPSYTYETGPDGRRYVVDGSVQIDTSPVPGDPEATLAKANTVRRAALAPAEPSGQDRAVAAKAAQMAADARAEISRGDTADPGAPATEDPPGPAGHVPPSRAVAAYGRAA